MPLNATYDRPPGEAAAFDAPSANGHQAQALAGSFGELLTTAKGLLERQVEIWLTKLKMKVIHLGMVAGLLIAAAGLIVVGLVFGLIGLFRILTDVAHIAPVWASLIFAGICVVLACACCIPIFFTGKKKDKK
jgi:hypothetical protein